jgi:hypothetical protein
MVAFVYEVGERNRRLFDNSEVNAAGHVTKVRVEDFSGDALAPSDPSTMTDRWGVDEVDPPPLITLKQSSHYFPRAIIFSAFFSEIFSLWASPAMASAGSLRAATSRA